jgi:hypothetical protein
MRPSHPSQWSETGSAENLSGIDQREEERREERAVFRPQHLERFRQLYQEQFGVWLSEAEAQRQLKSLVTVVRYQRMNRPESQGTE